MGASGGNGSQTVWDFVRGLVQRLGAANSGSDSNSAVGAGTEQPRVQDDGLGQGASRRDSGLLLRNAGVGESREVALQLAADLCRRFEGLYLKPYLCPAGVATIGFGSTYYMDGRSVKLTDPPITKQEAEEMLLAQIRSVYLPAVLKLCPSIENPDRLAALVDFAFNLGVGNLKSSTLRKRVNAGDWEAASIEIMKWTKAGGKVLRGLVLRREAERQLILKG